MERIADFLYFLRSHHHIHGQIVDIRLLCGNELMERGIQETDGNRSSLHYFVETLEITLLIRDQIV